jgi:23S rRNA (guanosine2251-2'-O)-methyltransferase
LKKEFLYGINCVAEALTGRRKIYRIYVDAARLRSHPMVALVDRARGLGVSIEVVDTSALRSRVGNVLHQGVVAEAAEFPYLSFGTLASTLKPRSLVLVLDHIEDPQNLGSMLRSAEAAGVNGVVIPLRRAAHVTPTVSHASAGAAEHMAVSLVPNLASALRTLKDVGLWVVGLENRMEARVIWDADLTGGLALVVGSEGRGVSPVVCRECDLIVKIPMLGKVNSLNAAVACSLALYEALRQRRDQGG